MAYKQLRGDYDEPIDPYAGRDPFAGQVANIDWSGYGGGSTYSLPKEAGTVGVPWYQSIVNIAAPLSQAAGNIIRAVQGQPQGAVYDPRTGRFVPAGIQQPTGMGNWLIPALVIGGGAFLLMRKK